MNVQTKIKDEEELGVLHIIIPTNNYCSHKAFKTIHHMDVRAGIIGSVTKQWDQELRQNQKSDVFSFHECMKFAKEICG